MRSRTALFLIAVLAIVGITACARLPTTVNYETQGAKVNAKVYHPAEEVKKPVPGILVLHTSGGYSKHEEDVAARLAQEGYITMTMPYMERGIEGTVLFSDPKINQILARMEQIILDGLKTLRTQPGVDKNRIGVVGYSLGGYFVSKLLPSAEDYGIKAAVIYYGSFEITVESVPKFRAPVLVFQGDADKYPNFLPRARAAEASAKKHGKSIELVVYPGAMHQFDFDYLRDRYDSAAAEDAWNKTVAFLDRYLK